MADNVDEIVRKLTPTQRHVLRELKPGWKHRATRFSGRCASALCEYRQVRRPLLVKELTMGGRIAWYGLTLEGEAVRARLMENRHG